MAESEQGAEGPREGEGLDATPPPPAKGTRPFGPEQGGPLLPFAPAKLNPLPLGTALYSKQNTCYELSRLRWANQGLHSTRGETEA